MVMSTYDNEPCVPCLERGPYVWRDGPHAGHVATHCMEPEGHDGPHRFVRDDEIIVEYGPNFGSEA